MLHIKTVEPDTFSLLRELMAIPELQEFSLVGGTALSLLLGHRTSVDIDLFSVGNFNTEDTVKFLKNKYLTKLSMEQKPPHFGIFCYIAGVKVDFVRHPHSLLRPIRIHEGIRMFSTEDIIAMKVQAILGRGRKKDFWDIAELLNHFSVADFVKYHREKYAEQNLMITVPQAITYFADADDDQDPVSLKGQTWDSVRKSIQNKVNEFLK